MMPSHAAHAFQQTEGIVLRAIPFQDYDQIMTLFTSDSGIIKVLFKGSLSKRRGVMGCCIPLTKVQVVYREKKGEIFSCHEMALIDSFSFLRKELIHLEVACELLQILLCSQLVGKAAPQLYDLLCFYLKKIPYMSNPWTLSVSFRLKLLNHDGLVAFPFRCSECRNSLFTHAFLRGSEWWCGDHQPIGSQPLDQDEVQTLYRLALSRSFQEICAENVSAALREKTATFFEASVRR